MIGKILCGLFLSLFTVGACGGEAPWEFHSLALQQPTVLRVDPAPDSTLANPVNFKIDFSERVEMQSLLPISIALIRGPWQEGLEKNPKELVEALEANALPTIPLNFELEGEERTLHVTPRAALETGTYHLAITPRLLSIQGVPFNQTPGASPEGFVAHYGLGASGADGLTGYGPAPETLVINEILYDGTLSESDGEAFVELFGSPGGDISGYEVRLLNGADGAVTDTLTLPTGSQLDSQGLFVIADLQTNSTQSTRVEIFHYLDHFDPQNGPDAVHLVDRDGRLWDALWYGEGAVSTTPEGTPLGEGAPALDVTAGHSLSRLQGLDTQNNQQDFIDLENPTPGRL